MHENLVNITVLNSYLGVSMSSWGTKHGWGELFLSSCNKAISLLTVEKENKVEEK